MRRSRAAERLRWAAAFAVSVIGAKLSRSNIFLCCDAQAALGGDSAAIAQHILWIRCALPLKTAARACSH
jgi:hypothetical protein